MKGNKEGFWAVQYAGPFGSGFGMLALDTQIVVGADAFGGIWDGTYAFDNGRNAFDVVLTLKFPPEVVSAVTGQGGAGAHEETITFSLPNDFDEQTISLSTNLGPVNAKFRKIRDFPD